MTQESTVRQITGLSFLVSVMLVCFSLLVCTVLQYVICMLASNTVPEHHEGSFRKHSIQQIAYKKPSFLLKLFGLGARDGIHWPLSTWVIDFRQLDEYISPSDSVITQEGLCIGLSNGSLGSRSE